MGKIHCEKFVVHSIIEQCLLSILTRAQKRASIFGLYLSQIFPAIHNRFCCNFSIGRREKFIVTIQVQKQLFSNFLLFNFGVQICSEIEIEKKIDLNCERRNTATAALVYLWKKWKCYHHQVSYKWMAQQQHPLQHRKKTPATIQKIIYGKHSIQ